MVIAEAFQPGHSEPIPPDLDFRLVFFTLPRRISCEHTRDRRTALASPTRPPDTTRQGLASELAAIRETRARYTADCTLGGPPSVEAPMVERESQLMAQIARRDATKYTDGRVYTRHGSPIDATAVFTGDEVVEFLRQFLRSG